MALTSLTSSSSSRQGLHRVTAHSPSQRVAVRRTASPTDLRQDPVRQEIFAALQQWHDPQAVSDARVEQVRTLIKALPYEWKANTGNMLMPPGEMRFLPVAGGAAAVTADGWVHADFTEASGDFIRIFPRWLDSLMGRPKTHHLKFNIFDPTLRVVSR